MSRATAIDEADAHDRTLLEQGHHDELLARHYSDLVTHVRIGMRGAPRHEWEEVAHRAVERLVRELSRGAEYGVPFRVVAFQVARWAVQDWRRECAATAARDGGEPEEAGVDAGAADAYAEVEMRQVLAVALADLPEGDRAVASLRWLVGLEVQEIADRTGRSRNAVDQALHRARRHLREALA